ncbi:hypothetical protein A5320_07020 [Rheinheimera sp. SA_1]|uniref:cadherin-like domain-containing protein n=1 Tax=Rheinheimera sp. SA_1 TaxID=1827365 RepID=UPI0007FEC789|nr:cadherin-like domain-containing protein [Rheinheimera sp. SA_1]OBP15133.1 hypothetical protein A5320_07020 [Rheinheimera sp. SA_1]
MKKIWNQLVPMILLFLAMTTFASTVTKVSPVHVIAKPAVIKDIFLDKAVSYQGNVYVPAMMDFRWPFGSNNFFERQGEQLVVLKLDATTNEFSLLTELPNIYFKEGYSYYEMLKELPPLSIAGDDLLINGYQFNLKAKTFNTALAKPLAPASFIVLVKDPSGQVSCIGSVLENDLQIDCVKDNAEPLYAFKLDKTQANPTIWVRDNHLIVQASDKFYRVADDNQQVLLGQLPQALADFSIQSVNQTSVLLFDKTQANAVKVEFELHLYNFSNQQTQRLTINAGIGAPMVAMTTTDDSHQIGYYAKTAEQAGKTIRAPVIQKLLANGSLEMLWKGSEFESFSYGEEPPTVSKAGERWLWNFASSSQTREYRDTCARPALVAQTTTQFNCLSVPKLEAKLLESDYYTVYLTSWQRQLFWRESGLWTDTYDSNISSSVIKRLQPDNSRVDLVQKVEFNDGLFGKRPPFGGNLDNFIQTKSNLWLNMFSRITTQYPFLFRFDKEKQLFERDKDKSSFYLSHRYEDNMYSLSRFHDMSYDFRLEKLDLNTGKLAHITDIVNQDMIGFVGTKLALRDATVPNWVDVPRLFDLETGEKSAALTTLKITSREFEGETLEVIPVGFMQQGDETWLLKFTGGSMNRKHIDELQAQKIDLQTDTFLSEPFVINRRVEEGPLQSPTLKKNILLFDDVFLNGTTAVSTSGVTLPEVHTPLYRSAAIYGDQLIAFNPQLTVYKKQNQQFKIQSQIKDLLTYPVYSMIGDKLYFLAFDAKEGLGIYQTTVDNPSPTALPDAFATDDRTAITIDVLKNDSDAGGDIIRLDSASTVVGTVVMDADQKLRFTPTRGFNGPAEITYTISDTDGAKVTTKATVMVTAKPNQLPVAVADQAATDHLSAIVIDVLANDTDADQDKLELFSAAVNTGTVSITTDQKLSFVPAKGFNGVATIQYQIRDPYLGTASGVAEVRITGPVVEPIKETPAASKGGAFPLGFLGLFFIVAWRQRYNVHGKN